MGLSVLGTVMNIVLIVNGGQERRIRLSCSQQQEEGPFRLRAGADLGYGQLNHPLTTIPLSASV